MIAKVQDDWGQPVRQMSLEALSCLVLLRFGIVTAAGEIGEPEFIAHIFDDAKQGILFNPALGAKILSEPQVFAVLFRDRGHNV